MRHRVEFFAKYGLNKIILPIDDGIEVSFTLKYGKNFIVIPTSKQIISFVAKYGKNVVEFEVLDDVSQKKGLWNAKVTIYNDIPADGVNKRRFDRFVIENCNIQGGYVEKADGTIHNIVNAQTIITRDVEHYKSPREYALLPVDEKDKFFTVQVNDFIVLGEVDDVVTTSKEFEALQEKYGNYGILVTAVNPYIFGMSTDNVTITNT